MCTMDGIIYTSDVVFSLVVVTPVTLLWWSGTWALMDIFLYPSNLIYSYWISLAIGCFITLFCYFVAGLLKELVVVRCSLSHVLISRIFIYINSFGFLSFWRGVWNLSNEICGTSLTVSAGMFLGSQFLLVLLRASSNSLGSPFLIIHDHREDFYRVSLRYGSDTSNLVRYTADVLHTQLVIHTITVQVWRGLWYTLDALILPQDNLKSYEVCLGVGLILCLLLLLSKPLLQQLQKQRDHWLWELLVEDVVNFISVIALLFLWRGGWGFMKDFVIVDDNVKKYAILFHFTGTCALFILSIASSVTALGCGVDGNKEIFQWDIQYFSHFYEQYQARRTQQLTSFTQGPESLYDTSTERQPLLNGSIPRIGV